VNFHRPVRKTPAPPEAAGYNQRLSKLNEFKGGRRSSEMVRAFVSSNVYPRRFGRP
jgi:hypothetical protein